MAGKREGVPGVMGGVVQSRRLGETNHEKNEETQDDSGNPRQQGLSRHLGLRLPERYVNHDALQGGDGRKN